MVTGLKTQQSLFTKSAARNKAATEAPFILSHLAKNKGVLQMVIYSRKQWL